MININCTGDCKYQKNGKCTMVLPVSSGHSNGICAYYSPNEKKEKVLCLSDTNERS